IEQRLAHLDLRLAAPHSVVESHNPLLRLGQLGMRTDLQRDFLVPIGITAELNPTRLGTTRFDNPSEEEILVGLVDLAEGPSMPPKAVEADGVRRDPAPAGLRPRKRLIFDLDGKVVANGAEHGPQRFVRDIPRGNRWAAK